MAEPILLSGVIGHPIGHSLSPRFQNAAFAAHLPAGHYLAWDVPPDDLAAFVETARTNPRRLLTASLSPLSSFAGEASEWLMAHEKDGDRALSLLGFNATLPHKEALMKLVDRCNPLAAAIGAVNTVVIERDRVENSAEKTFNAQSTQTDYGRPQLVGYNTDAPGFRLALSNDIHAAGIIADQIRRVLLLGASGAARGAAYGLLADPQTLGIASDSLNVHELFIANRTHAKAEALAEQLRIDPLVAGDGRRIAAVTLLPNDHKPMNYDLIVNATSFGVRGEDVRGNAWLNAALDYARPDVYAYDLVYRLDSTFTPFIAAVLEKRPYAVPFSGEEMLIMQGALAFNLWTGIAPPFMTMAESLGIHI